MRMFVDPGAIYLHRDVVDFRKSINGLMVIVEQEMELSPFAPALFVFCNRNRDRLKVLYWEGLPHERSECFGYQTGFCLWYKRLEKEKFKWPRRHSASTMTLSEVQWDWLLSGYDVVGHQALKYAHCTG
jgi:transposase